MSKNGVLISLLLVILPIIWSATAYFIDSSRTIKRERFDLYNNTLVEISKGGREGRSSSRRALIYELRFFDEYAEFTCRELKIISGQITNKLTLEELKKTANYLKCNEL